MKTILKPECEECQGKEFTIVCEDEVRYIPASEYFTPQGYALSPAGYPQPQSSYRAICQQCGKIYKY